MGRWMWKQLSLALGALVACGDEQGRDSGQACPKYGCYSACVIKGHVRDAQTGAPIPGLLLDNDYDGASITHTDAEGTFRVEMTCCGPVVLHDEDGQENGCYATYEERVQTRVLDPGGACRFSFSIGWAEIAIEGEPAPCTVPEDTGER